jgi:hypothetical protein
MKVLMLEEQKKKKDFEHFGNPFTATGVAGLIHVGEFFDDCRRI